MPSKKKSPEKGSLQVKLKERIQELTDEKALLTDEKTLLVCKLDRINDELGMQKEKQKEEIQKLCEQKEAELAAHREESERMHQGMQRKIGLINEDRQRVNDKLKKVKQENETLVQKLMRHN